MTTRALAVVIAAGVAGCGFGYHRNSTAALTAPYHDHQDDIAGFPALDEPPAPSARPRAAVGFFERYYPTPIGFRTVTVDGQRLSWGTSKLVGWSEIQPAVAPEETLRAAFRGAVAEPAGASAPRLDGVVTEVSWYEIDGARGGRITSVLSVQAADGRLLFEGDRTTVGRADQLEVLVRTHVAAWMKDPGLQTALRSGGTP